ncbi:glutamate-1-semialdehyde 2,1-aminomutase [Candidatus Poriferisodalis multihospitum]|uniref:glutamate-1-semialdehyde 2,1-aminomutase n=1 Tax=Candidatus Poriferisodalis multihospitum TaxID=2983191 RepID=UPI002B258B3C|nr:glutamate-1-semialdehyde 2,1-aminomutase [Candidatus Poriferisodalis multihospitum]
MTEPRSTNADLFEAARRVIPGGVNSPVRAFGSVDGTPYFVARAEGPYVFDVEGRRYLDFVQSYGAIILGHAHPAVTEAITAAAADGTSYGAPTEREIQLASLIAAAAPGVEQVRLVNSGTEAAMTAVRLARGYTGRQRIVKFAGCYHGHTDALLAAGGSGVATLGLSGSAGVPPSAVADTVVVPYNEVPELDDQVAAVIVEPVAANMGLVPPVPSFLAGLRQACTEAGALLIFDEVITGFRLGPGGAAERYGVTPDISCFGKVIGGGLPIGALGAGSEIMETLAPNGPVYQAGTLSGNPLATAAGLAVLEQLTPAAYAELESRAGQFANGLRDVLTRSGFDAAVVQVGTLVGLYCGPAAEPGWAPVDYDDARTTDEQAYARLHAELLKRGVAFAPGAYEAIFVSLAHSPDIIDEALVQIAAAASTRSG